MIAQTTPRLERRALLPVLGAFFVGAIAYAPPYCFPILSTAYQQEFHIDQALTVTPWTVFLLATALLSPILGRAYDLIADRLLLAIGVLLLAAGWVVSYFATDVSLLVLAYGVFEALGIQLVFVGTTTAIARRYPGITGLALGIAYAGPGIGLAVVLPFVPPLVASIGWRGVSLLFAALSLAGLPFVRLMTSGPSVVVPAAASVGRGAGLHEASAPGAVGASQEHGGAAGGTARRPDALRRILRTKRFWILLIGAVGIGTIDEGVYQFFVKHAVGRGIAEGLASQILALQAFTYVVGQVVGGGLSDRFGRRYVGLIVGLVVALGTTAVFLADERTAWLALVGNAAYGFAIGATIAIRSAVFSDVFGGRNFGAVVGIMAIAYPLGGIIVMQLGARGYDQLGNYWPVYVISIAALVWWSVALVVAGPRRHGLRSRLRSVRTRVAG